MYLNILVYGLCNNPRLYSVSNDGIVQENEYENVWGQIICKDIHNRLL
jgi:hypothetical protein